MDEGSAMSSAARGVQVAGWARAARPGEAGCAPGDLWGPLLARGLPECSAGEKLCEQRWAAGSALQWAG